MKRMVSLKEEFNSAFWAWFRQSKVVDDRGNPMIVYHGGKKDITQFDTKTGRDRGTRQQLDFGSHFTADKSYAETYAKGGLYEVYLSLQNPLDLVKVIAYRGEPHFEEILELRRILKFKDDPNMYYGKDGEKHDTIQSAFINQFFLDQKPPKKVYEALIAVGFDGVIYEPYQVTSAHGHYSRDSLSFIALFPEQIKSVDNTGLWGRGNPNIHEGKSIK